MNKQLQAMAQKRNALRAEAQDLLTAAQNEERPLNNNERDRINKLKGKIARWDETICEFEDMLEDETPTTAPVNKADAPAQNAMTGFANFGEQLRAVYNAALPDRPVVDSRLFNEASGASEGVPSDGGFLVQTDFATELLKDAYETGILAPRCRRIPLSSNANGLKINAIDENSRANGARWGGIQAFWTNEADQIVASKPKFRQMELSLQKLTGVCYATDELLQDAAALESVITQGFAEEFGFKIDDAIINGTGTGQPLGILAGNGKVTVSKEAGQTEKLVLENITKMWSRCWGRSRKNAVWYINQELEPYLYGMKIGDVPVYVPAGGLAETPFSTLLGRPVIPIEQCAAAGSVGDIILADLSQYLLIDKGSMSAASSIHVRFLYDENVFKFIYRVDGQPIWANPLTPYKGAGTLSPYVVLQAR